jgi:PPK2 family polyphosphate:nucleotide phosphotransferase
MKKATREELLQRLLVPPRKKVSLKKDYDPGWKPKSLDKDRAEELLEEGIKLLAEQQEMLYAQDCYSLLVVLQALDAAGKDGTIKHVMSGVNPQGCQVFSFKAPSPEELDHDYLWRSVKALPERGRIGIFNRSYYEEVLVARVHPEILERQKLPPGSINKGIWKRRYEEINNFEKRLRANGTVSVKLFLYVSKDEQKRRFLSRIEEPEKNWKFSVTDAQERQYWDQYIEAYEDCLRHTSTKWAPWYVIPADFKPFTRLAAGFVILEALRSLKLAFPTVSKEHRADLQKMKALLESEP